MRQIQPASRGRKQGFVLVYVTLSIVVLLGLAGLAIDVGHMYVVRAEAQSFCDAAALAAAAKLDGTNTPLGDAQTAAMATRKNWDFENKPFTTNGAAAPGVTVSVKFGSSAEGPFTATPGAGAKDIFFTEVKATAPVSVSLLQVIVGQQTSQVAARAVAGRQKIDQFEMGLGPFAPISARKAADVCAPTEMVGCAYDLSGSDPFGLIPGHDYTLRWPAGIKAYEDLSASDIAALCEGDRCPCAVRIARESGMDTFGYALYNDAKNVKEAILGDPPPLGTPLTVGSPFLMSKGNMQAEMGYLNDRVNMDSDKITPRYAGYVTQHLGNGIREMPVPIASWNGALDKNKTDFRAAGFAGFFLFPTNTYGTANTYGGGTPPSKQAACAQYFGEYTYGAPGTGGTGPGGKTELYVLRLYK
jgi:Flp pilus assembly protein TadG